MIKKKKKEVVPLNNQQESMAAREYYAITINYTDSRGLWELQKGRGATQ